MRPLLFLDVDGPLIPFGAPGGYPEFPPETEDGLRERDFVVVGEWLASVVR
ncbi:hypothetical protein SRB5_59460 [Streptomyces sp. RB5]|uniref:Uncharacterized protein n=1 Tax=Streptomyces smaragdinus TaxID=2585196 RepID=A0A7K0CQJ8_9ACTN|nr:hypothetical protein [Streptomyces smaragdinus]MQY15755.1 hypothetical protein [Streptomyces smaragdinus]